ncbi:hypothetical protein OBBRIDRAFT_828403 [Obba rivulosa]|uniref:Uncharacterized protein n=1 Tax=Obba rivulosa TaxID=1052685 RepID=A0A8E2AT79_9APHY|nr:hypothetical protein OBBRIDRAFT_828403 [Obba rivulosa]
MAVSANIVSLFFTAFFLGIHLVTSYIALRSHFVRRRRRGRSPIWLYVVVIILMGSIGTLSAVADVILTNEAWIARNADSSVDVDLWINIVENPDSVIQPLIGDVALIYRCWLVYEHNRKTVAAAIMLWLGASSMIMVIIAGSIATNIGSRFYDSYLTPLMVSALSLTVALNVITTLLVMIRLCTVIREIRQYNIIDRPSVDVVAHLVIDSGLLYTITVIITLGVRIALNGASYLLNASLVQISGIAFNLIIIRAGRFPGRHTTEEQVERFIQHALQDHSPDPGYG